LDSNPHRFVAADMKKKRLQRSKPSRGAVKHSGVCKRWKSGRKGESGLTPPKAQRSDSTSRTFHRGRTTFEPFNQDFGESAGSIEKIKGAKS